MKIAYSDLKSFLVDDPSIESISDTLFQLGHENHILNDNIIDVEFTPNRGDCLSLNGLARDLNFFFKKADNKEAYSSEIDNLKINFINKAQNHCPSISFMKLEVSELPYKYKGYLENYFKYFDIKKNNFFTDISNYIAYELGQPTHCYDMEKIKGGIVLETINQSKVFKSVTGKEINLVDNNLVFTNNGDVINLAGVMGEERASCSKDTKKVLIECAYFLPESIIGTALKYDLHSDAAYKFERGVDPLHQEAILRRFISIVLDHIPINKISMTKFNSGLNQSKLIYTSANEISSILGNDIADIDFNRILSSLGFIIENNKIKVPSYRNDIYNQNDIAEEVARILGYDNIIPSKLSILKKVDSEITIEDKLRNFLMHNGFNEVINQSFSYDTSKIVLDNPIDSNRPYIRKCLKNSLLDNLIYNERRQKDIIKLFEISDIYDVNNGYSNYKKVCIVVTGRIGKDYLNFSKTIDRNYIKNLFKECLVDIDDSEIIEISRSQIDSKGKNKIYLIESSLDVFKQIKFDKNIYTLDLQKCPNYHPISEYPSIMRDLSFTLKNINILKEFENHFLEYKADNLKDIFVFDYFKNSTNGDVKLGIRFTFQSHNKTLKIEDVNPCIDKIINEALKFDGVSLQGFKLN